METRIAMTGDSNYVYPLGVAIHSLARFGPENVQLDLALPLDWRVMITEHEISAIEELVSALGWRFNLVECPIEAAELPRTLHISPITFVKPAYFDVCDAEVCLFVDADAIAVGNWTEMAGYVNEHAIAAARESNMTVFEEHWNAELPRGWYANAGMLVCRPELWRSKYTERWRYLMDTYDKWEFTLLEQDVLNATLLGESDLLASKYNTRPNYGQSVERAKIIHYAGWWKPWFSSPLNFALPTLTRAAFSDYGIAEDLFFTFIRNSNLENGSEFWVKARRKIRGKADVQVANHVGRGLLSGVKSRLKRSTG
jgi:lipopolysaccharide biosynthesis glycosyltransferase